MACSVHPMKLAELTGVSSKLIAGRSDIELPDRLPVISYAIRDERTGTAVVVDLGPPDPQTARSAGRNNVAGGSQRGITDALAAIGIQPDQVVALVFTHLHWDHIWGSQELPSVPVYVQRAELDYVARRCPGQERYYQPDELGHILNRAVLVDGDRALFEGLDLVALPGHTPGSQGVLAATADGPVLCSGDLIYRFDSLVPPAGESQPVPPQLIVDEAMWRNSLEKALSLGRLMPCHDERVFSHPGLEEHDPGRIG